MKTEPEKLNFLPQKEAQRIDLRFLNAREFLLALFTLQYCQKMEVDVGWSRNGSDQS